MKLDYIVAAVLTIVAEIEVWLGSEVETHKLWGAIAVSIPTASVAIRRRHPALVGIVVPVWSAFNHAFNRDPSIIAAPIGYFCALYALAVWTSPRVFRVGLGVVVTADLVSAAGPGATLENSLPFTIVTVVALLLVRTVIRDRERRTELAERERDVAGGRRSSRSGVGSRASSTTRSPTTSR